MYVSDSRKYNYSNGTPHFKTFFCVYIRFATEEIIMESTSVTKKCVECKHYVQHYIRSGTAFRAACCGHCACKERNSKLQNKFHIPDIGSCELWEPVEIDSETSGAQIEKTLFEIAQKLNDIANILLLDKQNKNPSE